MQEHNDIPVLQTAMVIANDRLCREHFRITFCLDSFATASPGQFVHISPGQMNHGGYQRLDYAKGVASDAWRAGCFDPLLRRAFSIAGLRRRSDQVEIDLIYREVGTATHWMSSRCHGDAVSVLGPLGNRFEISQRKRTAWLVAGGVGLPPMLWLAAALTENDRKTVAFCGAQTRDLLALTVVQDQSPSHDATLATCCAAEFARANTPVVLSTDDGSLGFRGHIGQALSRYHETNPIPADDLVVYTCGPERMMRFVSDFCGQRGIECKVCMERAMACGTGTCQSCVVPIRDDDDRDGWRYRLCCTDGPVFDGRDIVWEPTSAMSDGC
ncbi:MAG: dihydroorotate dehydrogenase electron transfer subunit [Planctomycetes bacterium]|nr:dihydroorotate dehydrogenase electron transfer subunit [Planctomycetota bacterium]